MASLPGSYRAVRRVAARRRERGREDGLEETVVEGWKGRGAGSGQVRGSLAKVLGVGIVRSSDGLV